MKKIRLMGTLLLVTGLTAPVQPAPTSSQVEAERYIIESEHQ